MQKNNVRIKTNITLSDKVNAIEGIVSSYFTNGEYTPYYAEMGEIIAIVTYFMEGIEFEEGESIYNSVISDDDVMSLIKHISDSDNMKFIKSMVEDKVIFLKELFANKKTDIEMNQVEVNQID